MWCTRTICTFSVKLWNLHSFSISLRLYVSVPLDAMLKVVWQRMRMPLMMRSRPLATRIAQALHSCAARVASTEACCAQTTSMPASYFACVQHTKVVTLEGALPLVRPQADYIYAACSDFFKHSL